MGFERSKTTTRTTKRPGAHYQTRKRKGHEQNNNKNKDLKIGKNYDLTRTCANERGHKDKEEIVTGMQVQLQEQEKRTWER
jgi:hypothetical protein